MKKFTVFIVALVLGPLAFGIVGAERDRSAMNFSAEPSELRKPVFEKKRQALVERLALKIVLKSPKINLCCSNKASF